jgi:adenosine kinase
MSILICGSIAYDSIMLFEGRFREHILPEQTHILNVAFLVPRMRREFGGCAGNIAYNLKMLGATPLPMATVGDDAQPYLDRLDRLQIDRRFVRHVADTFTAQAFITTDLDDNQITAFHPGAMAHSHLNRIPSDGGIKLGIVSPDGREGMLEHARQFANLGIPYVFDPGQGLPMFDGDELMRFIAAARFVTVNDYEARVLVDRTGIPLERLAEQVEALVVTLGPKGSRIFARGHVIEVPIVPPREMVDPTGCGDAYRAGLLYGIVQGMDWPTIGRLASLMGALKIEKSGGQNHYAQRAEIGARFAQTFGYRLW